ncbi:amidophosphoribosyltransferase [Prevotella sp. CAG:592]|nr:amidophosphoribosyltransferase [Prevotella sp. CAG:592]
MNNEDFITFADGNKITNKYIYMGGIFGTISKKSCVADLFYGTDYNSHLGTRRGGMATFCKEKGFVRSIHNLESSYFRTKFEPTLDRFEGATSGIGVISDTDAQPLIMNSHLGKFAICTVAKILNKDELTIEMLEKNMHFAEMSSGSTNPTELVALLIIQGKTFKEGIENVYRHIKGSCTMLLLTDHGIICARDSWGRTPIIIGKKDGAYAASSESTSFPNLDFDTVYNVGPGEIVKLTADGMEQIRKPNKKMQVCSFLWVYYGFPTSTYEGKNVEQARFDNGFNMAKTDPVEVDCCSGIPDSGTGMAMGYAAGKNVPYQRCIAKYTPTWPRSFTPSNQSMRSLVAKMKLIPNKAMLQGKKVLFCDDSIVRGTQLRDNVKVLFDQAGLKECHMRIACPPLVYGCPFINFTSSKSDMELITRRMIQKFEGDPNKNLDKYATTDSPEYKRMVDEIAKELGLTTLKFNTIEQLIEAIGLPKCQVCTHCFDGSSQFSLETFADED